MYELLEDLGGGGEGDAVTRGFGEEGAGRIAERVRPTDCEQDDVGIDEDHVVGAPGSREASITRRC